MASVLDGLLVYRQYLENVRSSVKNYNLSELESKNFMDIIDRVNQIEDLAYIDVVLKNAGLNLSFIGDRKFLDEKVVLKSKLTEVLYKDRDMDETMRAALSNYMSIFMIEEDSIIDEIQEISQSVSSVSTENFPKSSSKYYSAKEIVEKNQDTLRSLFGALAEMDKKLNTPEPKETAFVEEYFDEDMPDEDLVLDGSDIRELISDEVENTENKRVSKKEDKKVSLSISKLEKEEEVVIENNKLDDKSSDFEGEAEFEENIDSEFFDDLDEQKMRGLKDLDGFEEIDTELKEIKSQFENINELDDFHSLDTDDEDNEDEDSDDFDTSFLDDDILDNTSDNKDFESSDFGENKYFDEEDEPDDSEFEEEDDFETFDTRRRNRENFRKKDFNKFLDSDEIKDETDSLLLDDLMDEEDRYFDDTDPIERSAFEEATNYFLTGKSSVYGKDDLSKLYKSKEKIVQSDDVSNADDAVAKMVLAVADGLIKLPKLTGSLFRKAKTSGRKMRENMIVEDDDNG